MSVKNYNARGFPRIRYLALGDSFTIGTGTEPDRSFPAVLASLYGDARRPCVLLNPAVNGYATDDLIREELPQVEAFRPTLVTLLIGANDLVAALRASGMPDAAEARYRAQLARIHERIRAAAPGAARYALPQPDWSRSPAAAAFGEPDAIARAILRFNRIAREEAERSGATFIDLYPLMRAQAAREMVAPDGLHPSAEAYAEWAAELATRI
jgi:acyl-CoA thioesterase-1